MAIPSIELQKALYSTLSAGDCPVFELTPDNQPYPFITLRIQSMNEDMTKTDLNRFKFQVYIHSWSLSLGSLESKTIDSFIFNLVMGEWEINGFNLDRVSYEFGETLTETQQEGTIFQGIQNFEITISRK